MAGTLHLGILAGQSIALSEHGQPEFGKAARYFQKLSLEARRRGIACFAFSASDVCGDALSGWSFTNRTWHRSALPLPEVVYDRWIHGTPVESLEDQKLARELEAAGIALINSSAFMALVSDKWRVHNLLSGIPRPDTCLLDSSDTLEMMLKRHGHVYLKPRSGSQTRHVMSVEASPKSLKYVLNSAGTAMKGRVRDASALHDLIEPERQYLVQQAIEPVKYDGKRVEIRVMMHKTPAGKWLRTGMVVRAGSRGSRFLSSGRETDLRPSAVMQAVFQDSHEEVLDAVRAVAREIPPLIEASGGPGAELAADVIPDAAGKAWLLEVNSKPSSLFLNTDSIRLRNTTIERILDYAQAIRCTS